MLGQTWIGLASRAVWIVGWVLVILAIKYKPNQRG